MFSSVTIFNFMLNLFAIYDRLNKGLLLIREKVEQDFKDDFSHENL